MAPKRARKMGWPAAIALLLIPAALLAGFGGDKVSGVLKAIAPQDPPQMAAKGGPSVPVLNKTGANDIEAMPANLALLAEAAHQALPALVKPADVTQPTMTVAASAPVTLAAPQGDQMPQNVKDWLQHLQRTEAARGQLAGQQVAEAATLLGSMQAADAASAGSSDSDDPSPERKKAALSTDDKDKAAWQRLDKQFASLPPPAECADIAAQYTTVLHETANMIQEIVNALNKAADDRQGALATLTAMQGQSTSRIDAPAKTTDSLVAKICAKYNTTKWFSIGSDFGTGAFGR